jgi:hypothetical protein
MYNVTNYVYLLFIAATCLGRTLAIIRQQLLGETTALNTLYFVSIGTSLSLLLICFIDYFILFFFSRHFSVQENKNTRTNSAKINTNERQ